jgi:hypothetical protein
VHAAFLGHGFENCRFLKMTESDEFPLRLIGEMFVQVKCRNKGVAEGKSRTMSFFHIVGGHLSENSAWPRAVASRAQGYTVRAS